MLDDLEGRVEIILDGEHGHGDCVQTEVDLSLPKDERYPAALADILTEFPTLASGGGMLMVVVLALRPPLIGAWGVSLAAVIALPGVSALAMTVRRPTPTSSISCCTDAGRLFTGSAAGQRDRPAAYRAAASGRARRRRRSAATTT